MDDEEEAEAGGGGEKAEAEAAKDGAFNHAVQRRGATSEDADEPPRRDTEESYSAVSSRPRRTPKRPWQPETPTKQRSELPKNTRGKRGGARPGSGRPRKHPRPVPSKPVFDQYDFPDDSPRWSTKPFVVPVAEKSAAAAASQSSWRNTMATTPEPKRTTRRSERTQVTEIKDSDDEAEGVVGGTMEFSIPSGRPRRDGHGHGHGNGNGDRTMTMTTTTTQHDKDKDKDKTAEDDMEDEDVRVRQRSSRTARIRRLPAKFRDEDIWK